MKRNGVLLTLLTVISLLLFLSQNLPDETNRLMHDTGCKIQDNRELCIEDRASEVFPHSEIQNLSSTEIGDTKLDKASFALKTRKLHMPFIANNGQMDGQVKFYAKTFGGTVFVTKEGEIVYALPANSSECRGEWHSPNEIHNEVGMLHDHHISDIVHPASWIVDHDKSELQNPKSIRSDSKNLKSSNPKSETCGEQSRTIQNLKSGVALHEEFVGSKVKAIQGEDPSVTKVSYFKGNDPSKWKTNISTYDAVNLGEIYDGIELKLRAYGNNVEKLFCVKPGADPEQIKIRLSGAKDCGVRNAEITHPLVPSQDVINPKSKFQNLSPAPIGDQKLQINKSGELEVETELGLVKFTKPVAYQEIEGERVEVECKYTIADCGMQNAECKTNLKFKIRNPKSEYGFKVASYDKTKPLIIDPLLASTYLGGSSNESGFFLALDTSGNVYVTGYNDSIDFPTTSGAYDTSYYYNDDSDVFISKLDSGLTSLLASTFLGGSFIDYGYFLVLDTSGNVYVTGYTWSRDFPTTSGAYDTSFGDTFDVFVSKLDGGLTSLLASTYLGGSGVDSGNMQVGRSITLDTSGDVYVTGWTVSTDFPTTSGAYDTSYNGGESDVFVSKLDSGLTSLLASTYLGGSGSDSDGGYSIALDTSGDVYVMGTTASTDFPTTSGAYDTSFNSSYDYYGDYYSDAFISKLDSGLTSLLASTYLGGSGNDLGKSLAPDTSGDVYVTGWTASTDFPTTSGAYDTSFGYSSDVFVSKLDSGLTSLLASTYLGGSSSDFGYSLTLDTSGNVYVTGTTYSTDFPTTSGAYDTSYNGRDYFEDDVFVSKLDGGLSSLLASTYLGGHGYEAGYSITLDTSGNVYVSGNTRSWNFPTTSGAYDTSYNDDDDVFISKLDGSLSAPITSTSTPVVTPTPTATPTVSPTPTPTATPTATPIECEPESIEASPSKLTLNVNESGDVVVTVTGKDSCPVEGETVTAKINTAGEELISVSPANQVTNENGETTFTITAKDKTGKARVTFKAKDLKAKVKVKVVK